MKTLALLLSVCAVAASAAPMTASERAAKQREERFAEAVAELRKTWESGKDEHHLYERLTKVLDMERTAPVRAGELRKRLDAAADRAADRPKVAAFLRDFDPTPDKLPSEFRSPSKRLKVATAKDPRRCAEFLCKWSNALTRATWRLRAAEVLVAHPLLSVSQCKAIVARERD